MDLMERVLTGDSGIERRQFAVGPEQVFDLDAEALNRSFEREAPALASEALQGALDRAGLDAGELDALYVCTCTGYLCPGVSSHVAERLGMRPDAWLHDLVGLGCAAAIPTLRVAAQDLAANPTPASPSSPSRSARPRSTWTTTSAY
jgi:alkylresorcinol/alkylpyrone synthase